MGLTDLIPVLPRGRGVCAVCWTAVDPDFRYCYVCNTARMTYGPRLADVVVPIALAVKREQFAHELWHYKYDLDASVRSRLTTRLAAVLWRFLGEHEAHIASAIDLPGFDIVTTVPGRESATVSIRLQISLARLWDTREVDSNFSSRSGPTLWQRRTAYSLTGTAQRVR